MAAFSSSRRRRLSSSRQCISSYVCWVSNITCSQRRKCYGIQTMLSLQTFCDYDSRCSIRVWGEMSFGQLVLIGAFWYMTCYCCCNINFSASLHFRAQSKSVLLKLLASSSHSAVRLLDKSWNSSPLYLAVEGFMIYY